MKLFGFLNSRSAKAVEENEMLPQIEAIEGTNDEDTSSIEEGKREASNIVTITYGTGMPIDVIFNFVRKDYENEGYNDALISTDPTYKSTKEGMIRNDLKTLFTQVTLKYKNDIRMLESTITNKRVFSQACLPWSHVALLSKSILAKSERWNLNWTMMPPE